MKHPSLNWPATSCCSDIRPDVEGRRAAVPPSEEDLAVLASAAPMMPGAEYLTVQVPGAPWEAIGEAFTNPAWNGAAYDCAPGLF